MGRHGSHSHMKTYMLSVIVSDLPEQTLCKFFFFPLSCLGAPPVGEGHGLAMGKEVEKSGQPDYSCIKKRAPVAPDPHQYLLHAHI